MAADTQQFAASLESLTFEAFEAFCEDIASMFGNAADCSALTAGQGPLSSELKREFKKLAAVNQVQAVGAIDGTFQLLLDQAGLFILAGVFVMLPERRVMETIRSGTLTDADYINDAIKEVGNLLVGSWDRVFREEVKSHKHFKQTGTFVGTLWDDTHETFGLAEDQQCRYVICRIKLDDFPEFKCAAVFSDALFDGAAKADTPESAVSAADSEAEDQTDSDSYNDGNDTLAAEQKHVEDTESADQSPLSATGESDQDDLNESESPPETSDEQTASQTDASPTDTPPTGPVSEAIRNLTAGVENPAPLSDSNRLPIATAGEIMTPAALWVSPEDTIEDVLRQMQQHNVGYVLAGQDGQIEGLVSRSDITAAISPYLRPVFAHWRRPADDATMKIRVKWFMSRTVHTIRPDASLQTIAKTMMKHSVRGLPVLDAEGRVVGVVTVYDVFAALLRSEQTPLTGRPQQAPPVAS